MKTKYPPRTQVFGERFDQAYDNDSHNELDLSEDERKRDYLEFMRHVEPMLDDYGPTILDSGEIVGEVGLDDLKERLGEW